MDELPIRSGDDVVRVRQQVRTVAAASGLSLVDQTKVVTAASELARNALVHGGGGTARIEVVTSGRGRSGIRPQVAQTIVSLGSEFGDIATMATLADALAHALRRTGQRVEKAGPA